MPRCLVPSLVSIALLLLAAAPAQAEQRSYRFTVTATSGVLAGESATGTFSFDAGIIPAAGGRVSSPSLFTAFDFTWDGIHYDLTNTQTGALIFDSEANLTGWNFGTACNAFHTTCLVRLAGGTQDWVIFNDPLIQIRELFEYGRPDKTAGFGTQALALTSRPLITTHPSNLRVVAGKSASFKLSASGATSFRWEVSTDHGGTWEDVSDSATYQGASTSTLTIARAMPVLHRSWYRAIAANDGGSATSGPAVLTTSLSENLGNHDVSGDGKADLVWRRLDTGDLAMWLMNGSAVSAAAVGSRVAIDWQIVGRGDIDGDGNTDLVWRHRATGDVAAWLLDGVVLKRVGLLVSGLPTAWEIAGMGDLDGDGTSDIVWRHAVSGDLGAWLMNGFAFTPVLVWPGVPLAWRVDAIGDLDGDGNADLVWRQTEWGDVGAWLMDGASVRQFGTLGSRVSLDWQIASAGDLNGDGRLDLVWRHTWLGDVATWLMNGTAIDRIANVASGVSPVWQIVDIGDVDGDGKADLVWRHIEQGDLAVWLIDGDSIAATPPIVTSPALVWTVQ